MSETNVVPLHPEDTEHQARMSEFGRWLSERLDGNEVAALTVRGIGRDGEPFGFDLIPLEAPTLRLIQLGQLEEAKAFLTGAP